MKLRWPLCAFVPCLLVAACATPNTDLDIATNDRIYVDVPFKTRAPGDRTLFIAPLADVRQVKALPMHERGFPISYGSDQTWDRPVRDMLDEVLARQLGESGLFLAIVPRVSRDSLVLAPKIKTFLLGAVENAAGARTFAEVGLQMQVYGPLDASGKRPMLLDETYSERQITEPTFKPVSPYLLVGSALRAAMQKTLAGLDTSNVGRSYLPAELAAPAGMPMAESAAVPAAASAAGPVIGPVVKPVER